jgi:tetratricopeptide (TPR) repeat protein
MYQEALDHWLRILDETPANKVILTRAGDALRNLKEFDEAEKYYNKALNIEFDVYAVLGLAYINKIKGNVLNAIQSLEGLIKADPRNVRIESELTECYSLIKNKHSK